MDWIIAIGHIWLTTLAWLAGLTLALGLLARLTPCNPGMYWWKDLRAVGTDFMYWFLMPLLLRVGRTVLLTAAIALAFGDRGPASLAGGRWPLWLQCAAILVIQDVLLYGSHRLFHTRLAWDFHAVHHSPRVLDWTATQRVHPVNSLLGTGLADVAVLLLGFSPAALVFLAPFSLVYSALVHANLNWTFGPLRYVFASPVFHRWHHTTLAEGIDKNFASTFPFLDVIFGTFYMPPGNLPEQFGSGDPHFPQGFWAQFVHPFRGRGARPLGVALVAVRTLAVVGTLGGALYFAARLAEQGGQPRQGPRPVPVVQPLVETPRPDPLPGRAAAVLAVAISADGRRVVSGAEDGTVTLWDAATGRKEQVLTGHRRPVRSVAMSADGRRVASGSFDQTVRVWDAPAWRPTLTLTGHVAGVLAVALTPDGRRIFSGSADGTIKAWDGATGREDWSVARPPGATLGVAVSADGRRAVWASWRSATVWDSTTGREVMTLAGHTELVYGVAVSPDGRHIVTGSFDQTVKVWDGATGRERLTLAGHTGPVYAVAVSADSGRVVSAGADGTVRVWDTAAGREGCTLKGHTDVVTGVAVSADGGHIVSGSRDGTVRVWDARDGSFRERVDLVRGE
jgi:sterol desaturase/sphingolipid hydroxylase (fatty acid hydroxylase superfamily)